MQAIKKVVKRVLPESFAPVVKRRYKEITLRSRLISFSLFSSSGFMSNLYYFLFSNEYVREHKATLVGKKKYYKNLTQEIETSYLLRRNVHRIEKGLIMPERRRVFGLDFIDETIDEFSRMVDYASVLDSLDDEMKWSIDVLSEYFSVVDQNNKKILECNERFQAALGKLKTSSSDTDEKFIPFVRDFDIGNIDYKSFFELSKRRRSVRFYEDRIPDREVVDKAILAAAQAPSACNRQPFTFRLFDEPDMVKKVASIPAGTKTFYKELPAVAVIVGHLDAYYRERDRHAIYVDGALAVMSFAYALETLGMSSCVINWGDEEPAESQMANLIGLGPNDRVLMLVAYGWPRKDLTVPYSSKRSLTSIRKYNEY